MVTHVHCITLTVSGSGLCHICFTSFVKHCRTVFPQPHPYVTQDLRVLQEPLKPPRDQGLQSQEHKYALSFIGSIGNAPKKIECVLAYLRVINISAQRKGQEPWVFLVGWWIHFRSPWQVIFHFSQARKLLLEAKQMNEEPPVEKSSGWWHFQAKHLCCWFWPSMFHQEAALEPRFWRIRWHYDLFTNVSWRRASHWWCVPFGTEVSTILTQGSQGYNSKHSWFNFLSNPRGNEKRWLAMAFLAQNMASFLVHQNVAMAPGV